MISVADPVLGRFVPVATLPAGGHAHATAPSAAEIELLEARGVPRGLVAHSLDTDELARIEHSGAARLVVIRAPDSGGLDRGVARRSTAVGIVTVPGLVVTVSSGEAPALDALVAKGVLPGAGARPDSLVLSLLLAVVESFLAELREIETRVDGLEERLDRALGNREVLELLRHQRSLVHLETALGSNRILLERLGRELAPEPGSAEAELLEDLQVELMQATEMARVYSEILSNTMDAFVSIISNNLNVVMKALTGITIVLSVPVLVASLYGMNVSLPGAAHPVAFVAVLLGSVTLAACVAAVLAWKRWL